MSNLHVLLFVVSDDSVIQWLKLYTTLGICRVLHPAILSLSLSIEWSVSNMVGHSAGHEDRHAHLKIRYSSERVSPLLSYYKNNSQIQTVIRPKPK